MGIDPNQFYGHTSGRWLWNEKQQMVRRWQKFDILELARLAAHAVGSSHCIRMVKLADGNFNKVFVITTNDGQEVIAKLPNLNAGPRHLITASEVATMDYVRNILRIPVSQVDSWSSSASHPVGAEYIIMEKCRGIELKRVWYDTTDRQKGKIVQKLVEFESAFVSSDFSAFGSLYYADDLSPSESGRQFPLVSSLTTDMRGKFAVGPTTDRTYFDHGRHGVDSDIEDLVWSGLEEHTLAGAKRELACIKQCSNFPDPQGIYYGPGQYRPNSNVKTRVPECFIKVARYLKPEDQALSKPVLWHTDLHLDNIFVDETDPTQITSIIDWQAVHIGSLFAQARHPTFLEFEGDIPQTFDANAIKLPDDYDKLSSDDQKAAQRLRASQILWKLYEVALMCECGDVPRAIRFGEGLLGRLPLYAGNVFSDAELLVEELLMQLKDEWSEMVEDSIAEPCPVHFTEKDRASHEEDYALWAGGLELMADFLQSFDAHRGWDGWVHHHQYQMGKTKMERFRYDFLAKHASTEAEREQWLEAWPFKEC